MKPTLIFDYDGTIHNTIKIYEPAFRATYKWLCNQGLVEKENLTTKQIANWLGCNSKDMWNMFQPNLAQKYKDKASSMIGQYMVEQIHSHKAAWYVGAEEVLTQLSQNYRMIILSNCKIAYREAHWNEFGMERWFEQYYDCESYGFAPKTEIVKEVKKKYPGSFVVIGDRYHDLECARSIGSPFIGCSYGFGQQKELDGSDWLIQDIFKLLEVL